MKKTHAAVTEGVSAVTRYQDVVVGERPLRATVYYHEWCMWLAWILGALGLFLPEGEPITTFYLAGMVEPRGGRSGGARCLIKNN